MSGLRTAGTKPEMALRRELHGRGLRFRVNVRDLPGSPDIVLSRARIAVFIDVCFWHGCPDHAVAPKANADWWQAKLDGNRNATNEIRPPLHHEGWLVVCVWEHEDSAAVATDVERHWRVRTGRYTAG
jgi:DNA mismatch endonuclease (patch repair protein)